MLNYFFKRLKKFVLFILILLILMITSLAGIFYSSFKFSKKYIEPSKVFEFVEKNKEDNKVEDIYFTEENKNYLEDKNIWAIRINKNGKVIESFNKPEEVKNKFEITDLVRFTRYYLNDYPVFTFVVDDGVLVLAYPKNSLDKFPFNYYSYDLVKINMLILLISIILFALLVYLFYHHEVKRIFKKLNPLQEAIGNIFDENYEKLEEEGELGEISKTINDANEKFNNLKKSQASWLRGISHDIRTPLTKISWEMEGIKTKENLDEVKNIENQVIKISRIIEDLNLTNSLENLSDKYFEYKDPISVIRKLIVNTLNENPSEEIIFENKINKEIKIKMDDHLFYRMLENILNNSLEYGDGKICIIYELMNNKLIILIKNEGNPIEESVIKRLNEENLSDVQKHGMGLFISRQICNLHKGIMEVQNLSSGVKVSFIFNIK
ncbi:HAMP domain-containing sensor histidine kinase [Peptoniphilus harei]|uniref:sensor histidine kinase n=1 Tax=Peptoniphilus harei TaxID=54005 RepID=UPI0028FFF00F|nr:HAMP domain-containing sensor histidine kinase [Peptoniphilus harei]MDU2373599.1 HAMP domain-containing sensor histidine kinase [Peptoniphilus harei]MDU5418288.1 HAMP domain-containing sensor histidine kinase [Peptoniphilus harei]